MKEQDPDALPAKKLSLSYLREDEDSAFSSEDEEKKSVSFSYEDPPDSRERIDAQLRTLKAKSKQKSKEIEDLSTSIMKRGAFTWGLPLYPDPKEPLTVRERMTALKDLQEWMVNNGSLLSTKELSKIIKDGSSHLDSIKKDTGAATTLFLNSFEPKWQELKDELTQRKTQKKLSPLPKEEALSLLRHLEALELLEELDLIYRQLIKASKRLQFFERLNQRIKGSIRSDFKARWKHELNGFMEKFSRFKDLEKEYKTLQESEAIN